MVPPAGPPHRLPTAAALALIATALGCGEVRPTRPASPVAASPRALPARREPITWGPWYALDGGRVSPDSFTWTASGPPVRARLDREDHPWIYAHRGDGRAELGRPRADGRSGLDLERAPRVEEPFAFVVHEGRPALVTAAAVHRRGSDGAWSNHALAHARATTIGLAVDDDDRVWLLARETEKVVSDPCRGQPPDACTPSPPPPPRWARVHVGRLDGDEVAWLPARPIDPKDHPSLGVDARGRPFLFVQDEHGATRGTFELRKEALSPAAPDGAWRFADVERGGRTGFVVLARRGDHVVAAARVGDGLESILLEARGKEEPHALGMREAPSTTSSVPDSSSDVLGPDGLRYIGSTRRGRLELGRTAGDDIQDLDDGGAPVVADAVMLAVTVTTARVCVAWVDRPRFPAILVRCRDAR